MRDNPPFVTALGILGCFLNGFAGSWLLFIVINVITRICYSASLTIYGSVLNDVTTEERMDVLSSYGYAWGYLGSCIPFLIALTAYILGPDMVGILPDPVSRDIGFGVTALWWLGVTLPLLRSYQQKNYVEKQAHAISGTLLKAGGQAAMSVRKPSFEASGFQASRQSRRPFGHEKPKRRLLNFNLFYLLRRPPL